MFGKQKKEKGITLISLIITIIIMLILATIAINVIIGDRGLFKKAKAAIEIHKKASVQEELQLAVDNGYAEEKTNKLKVAEDMEKDCPGIEWVYKSSLAGHYKGYDFTVIDEVVVMDTIQDNSNTIINGSRTSYNSYDEKYFWTYDDEINNITFTKDDPSKYTTNAVNNNTPWDVSYDQDNSIIAYLEDAESNQYNLNIISNNTIKLPANSNYFFEYFENVESINGLTNISTENVTNMEGMFGYCQKLTSLDLSKFNTLNVTNMRGMFSWCTNLESLSLGTNFNTSNVTDMSFMFADCENLISLDVSSFNTSNVTNMSYMFYDCYKLETLKISNLNTSNVTDMAGMFVDCENLISLDVSSFNTSNVTDMSYMFAGCGNLISLDLSTFNTLKVENMQYMFFTCINMNNLILGSKFKISSNNNNSMFLYFAASATDTNKCTIKCTQNVKNTITDNNLITNANVVII